MRADWTISGGCHLVVLGAALVSFAPSRPPLPMVESIPVNIVTDTNTSQMTQGSPSAPKQETHKSLVEKIDQPNVIENPAAKVAPKEVTASTDATPPPPPPEPKKEVVKKKAEPKRDLIAEALKKEDAKKTEQKKADAKVPSPPKRPPMPQTRPQPKFDPRQVEALLDKRTPQRREATGGTLNDTASLGTPRGAARQLTQSELDALRARLAQLWSPPAGAQNPQELVVAIRIRLKRDGTLAAPPMVTTSGQSPLFMAARDSAIRAVFRGQPFDMLRPETYEEWKDIEVTFDPRDMIRG
ncbi:MAG: cell envelope biogenesis protein TolA [Rhizobiales bacterium]|nr:cell envelope biogenesis protein TolA [Hyphomicrobiales bacterium]